MDQRADIKALLNRIAQSEGPSFRYNETAIEKQYEVQEENKSSTVINVLSIFGGLLSTIFFIAFLVITGILEEAINATIIGAICIIISQFLNRLYDKIIIDTLSISLFISGFALFILGLSQQKVDENLIAAIIGLIAFVSIVITRNYILIFLSVLIVNSSLLFLIFSNNLENLSHLYIALVTSFLVFIFLNEAKFLASKDLFSRLYYPLRLGLVLSLLSCLFVISNIKYDELSIPNIWISSLVFMFLLLYVERVIIKRYHIESTQKQVYIYVLSLLLLAPTLYAPMISGGLLIIVLSFLVNFKTGFYLGLMATIYFVIQFYYDLDFTLLTKSLILLGSGVLFLVFYFFIHKSIQYYEKV